MDYTELFPSVRSWEFLGFITGIFSVLLLLFTQRPSIQWFNWTAGVISGLVYFYLFYEWGLYGNMALQVPFVLIGLHGAWYWRGQLRGIDDVPEVKFSHAPWATVFSLVGFSLLLMFIVYPLLDHYGDPSPLWDGLILTLSLAAIYMQLRKYVQSWYVWILTDIIAVPFHWSQGHEATGVLYAAYMAMCFVGLYTWRREANA